MLNYTIRRLFLAIPTLLFISLVIFFIVKLSPSDPTANLPLTIPPEVREKIRESLGVNQPLLVQFGLWLKQLMISEPLYWTNQYFGTEFEVGQRIISYQTRSPVMDIVIQRMPQMASAEG